MEKATKAELEDLGYDEFFDLEWKSLKMPSSSLARVIAEHKEAYRVKSAEGEYLAKITGKQMHQAKKREDYPAVGDWVAITELDKERAVIETVLKRKTILQKKYSNKQDVQIIATNIDIAFIVGSLDRDFNLNRFERYFILANEGGIKPVIVLSKTDLISQDELSQRVEQLKQRFKNTDVIPTSVITEQGLSELERYIQRYRTYCFLGSSGVGKSSLINKLLKENAIKTKEVSRATGKGKHTTTAREMYFLANGGIVIDNPGTREVGIADAGLGNVFSEIASLSARCRYADCTHTKEPGCAVLKAIKDKVLDEDKYHNFIKLKKEKEHYEMTELEKRQKDRKFGQFIRRTLKEIEQ